MKSDNRYPFESGFSHLTQCIWDSSNCCKCPPFLPLCCWVVFFVEYTTISLTNHLSKDIWADLSVWLLQIQLLWAFMCRLLDMYSSSLPAFCWIPVVLGFCCSQMLPITPSSFLLHRFQCHKSLVALWLFIWFCYPHFPWTSVLEFFCFSVSVQRDWKLMLCCSRL